ncbi:penicillin-binding transpeptidase domain-containing protein [Zhenpiania hominis]|uniref:penicillin-binding transpeptidase domain-containing protein n=1 Tax=Zhenpiania hominis TaxID=2763644 RepID=UPI0039F4DCE9
MKKKNNDFKVICLLFVCILACMITGCANYSAEEKPPAESGNSVESENEISADIETVEADWSEYFNGRNGTAVIYDPSNRRYTVYNQKLAETRSSPCSTFKIISSLIALENGIILPEDSTRTWSGERFWNEDWNKDIDFREAFRTSCVWYFRQVIDDIGKDRMQKELEKLQYGNCDISDWEGSLNTNNNNRALTGFWIESSLRISPKEQTAVMERIFGGNSDYSEETQNQLKQVMLVPEQDRAALSIYGKTGMGKTNGVVVDAWFTGFAESTEGTIYFCVRLGETEELDVSSTVAKEIAIEIVLDYCM